MNAFRFLSGRAAGLYLTVALLGSAWPGTAATLVAGWTFNNQASQGTALMADQGTLAGSAAFTAASNGTPATLALNGDGTVTLGGGEVLFSTAINSTALAALKSNVTIWVSFTATGAASSVNSAVFGLMQVLPSATTGLSTFPAADVGSFGYQINSNSATNPTARSSGVLSDNATPVGPGSGYNTLTPGSPTSAAIEFNSTGTSYSYFDDTNGTVVSRGPTTSTLTLASFADFAIGRLLNGGADYGALTINEIQIYSGNLSTAEIAALAPAAVPEPGMAALLLVSGLAGLALSRRGRQAA